jgi:hypothetical protein
MSCQFLLSMAVSTNESKSSCVIMLPFPLFCGALRVVSTVSLLLWICHKIQVFLAPPWWMVLLLTNFFDVAQSLYVFQRSILSCLPIIYRQWR